MQLLGLVDAAVPDACVSTQVHVDEFALVALGRRDLPAETVELIQVQHVLNVSGDIVRDSRIEKDREPDRNLLVVETLGELKQDIGAKRMANQNDRTLMSVLAVFGDLVGDRDPAIVIEDLSLEAHQ